MKRWSMSRGIPVVKVFQQTIYSFKSFYAAIMYYKDNVTEYALSLSGADGGLQCHHQRLLCPY